ncbi:MAG: DUF1501 domain-containing protein [Anaerolinea sp.]|nr:DUF1501 domain-containing protein [Anaerolinea sp.]
MKTGKVSSRRGFLETLGAAAVTGVSRALFPAWMPRLAFRADQAPGDVLVVIFQRGGMDGLNAVVPFGEGAAYYDKRPTIAIPEPGINRGALDLNGFFGFHPALRPLHEVYQTGKVAVIHAVGSPDPTRSHFDAMEFMERGTPGSKNAPNGWLNRHLQTSAWQNSSPFRAVGMGTMLPSSLHGMIPALALNSITEFHLRGDERQAQIAAQALANLYTIDAPSDLISVSARDTFTTIELLSKLNASEYQPANGAAYPDGEFGMGLRQVAQLIKAGVGLEVACVDIGGWDTHEDQGGVDGQFGGLLENFGQGLAAFYADLGDAMTNVTLVTMSEFGRRADENASRGTDHGHGNCMLVMGGGVNGGVHVEWPSLKPEALDEGDLAITIDYRDILADILSNRVLNPALDQIFPNFSPTLRGITQARS